VRSVSPFCNLSRVIFQFKYIVGSNGPIFVNQRIVRPRSNFTAGELMAAILSSFSGSRGFVDRWLAINQERWIESDFRASNGMWRFSSLWE